MTKVILHKNCQGQFHLHSVGTCLQFHAYNNAYAIYVLSLTKQLIHTAFKHFIVIEISYLKYFCSCGKRKNCFTLHNKQSNFLKQLKEYRNKSLVCYHLVCFVIYHLDQFILKWFCSRNHIASWRGIWRWTSRL